MGDVLTSPIKEKELEDKENLHIRVGCCSMQGWRRRMEDAHIADLSQGLNGRFDIFGIFDGHGGKEVSQFVKNHFTSEFLSHPKITSKHLKQVISDTFLKMDVLLKSKESFGELKYLAEQSRRDDEIQDKKYGPPPGPMGGPYGMLMDSMKHIDDQYIAYTRGCTACVCIIDNDNHKIYFANAGDSRVVLYKNGTAFRMSVDHKPDLAIENNRIIKAGGWVENGRIKGNLNLSRGFGDLEYKSNSRLDAKDQIVTAFPDVIEEEMESGNEFIIIGCDGIWDCLSDQSACDSVNEGLNKAVDKYSAKISEILAQMIDRICAKDTTSNVGIGCDNMSCIVIQFKNS